MLKFEIDKSSHESLDDSIKALYQPHGDGYRLAVEGIDPADELKNALRKEREEKAEAKKRLQEIENAQTEAGRLAAEQRGEFEKLYKQEQEAKGKYAAELETLKQAIANEKRETTALSIVSTLTTDKARAELLRKEALQFVTYTPDGVKINGPDGAALTAEQLQQHLAKTYPFLVDGSKATGGGASGAKPGGASGKKFTEYTGAELSAIRKDNPAEYDRLKSEHLKGT
jgi:hypothetical protein